MTTQLTNEPIHIDVSSEVTNALYQIKGLKKEISNSDDRQFISMRYVCEKLAIIRRLAEEINDKLNPDDA